MAQAVQQSKGKKDGKKDVFKPVIAVELQEGDASEEPPEPDAVVVTVTDEAVPEDQWEAAFEEDGGYLQNMKAKDALRAIRDALGDKVS